MTYLLIVFLLVVLLPLLAASWRVSLLGLATQGALLAWMALRGHHTAGPAAALIVIDAILLRGIVAPSLIRRALVQTDVPRRNDVIPPNLFSWALVAALVFVAFRFSAAIGSRPGATGGALLIAVATSALLLGLFVLASQNGMLSQIVGLIRIENAIALFELQLEHHFVLPVQAALSGVFLATVALAAHLLRRQLEADASSAREEEEAPL